MASSPVATAAQAVNQDAAAQPAAQTAGASAKNVQSAAVQDTVTLSNGVPQQTPAEEAGLFQVTAPTLNSAPARVDLNAANANAVTAGAPNASEVKAAATAGALQAGVASPAVRPEPRVASAAAGTAPAAAATAPAPAAANTSAQAPATAPANPAASAAGAQTAAAPTSQSQTVLDQFTQYLQQLGLSPQAMNQMLQAAQILNNLDPPAIQQAIGELRAQAASLAAQATDAPLSSAPTVRAGVSSAASGSAVQPGAAGEGSGTTAKSASN